MTMGDAGYDDNAHHVVRKFLIIVEMMGDAGDDDNADHDVTKILIIVIVLKS